MKKLFAVLFCTLVMAGTAFADELSYEIDPVATAKAPWKVGERIVKKGDCGGGIDYDREFLGMAESGLAVVQDFYLSGEKLSDPVLMSVTTTEEMMAKSCFEGIEGPYTLWYKNGHKRYEGNYKNEKKVGIWREWDENGNLIKQDDFGAPKD